MLIHVEGQTEESFVNQVLAPHLYALGYTSVSARLLGNSRQRSRRGGIRNWDLVREGILRHLRQDREVLATTMVDYYRLPDTWPGRSDAPARAFSERASTVERKLLADVSDRMGGSFDSRRFVPYVVMHEFEGLLFSDPTGFGRGHWKERPLPRVQYDPRRFRHAGGDQRLFLHCALQAYRGSDAWLSEAPAWITGCPGDRPGCHPQGMPVVLELGRAAGTASRLAHCSLASGLTGTSAPGTPHHASDRRCATDLGEQSARFRCSGAAGW